MQWYWLIIIFTTLYSIRAYIVRRPLSIMQLRSRTLPPVSFTSKAMKASMYTGVPPGTEATGRCEPLRKKRKFEPEPHEVDPPAPEEPTNTSTEPVVTLSNQAKHDRDRILVFDTETTGLLPTKNHQTRTYPPVEDYPHILQLCFVVYHVPTQTVEETYNEYIRVDDAVTISPVITDITGITRELCCTRGVAVADALAAFYRAYQRCGVLVAHNIRFDKEVLMAEMEREHDAMVARGCDVPTTLFHYLYMRMNRVESVCTMLQGVRVPDPATGAAVSKWPKLAELHQRLFGTVPQGLHDARVDVMACLRCYLEMRARNPEEPKST